MDITYLGHASFRLKGRTTTLVTDPYDPKMFGLKSSKVSADIVTISHQHPDHNFLEGIKDVKKVISGPGEYEISGVSIIGISTFHDPKKGEIRGKNTIYIIEMDEIRSVHLGDLGHKLSDDLLEEIGTVDILMIPVGGVYTLDQNEAVEVVREIEPSIVIPMHYKIPEMSGEGFGGLTGVDEFLKEIGLRVEETDKLSVKKADLTEEKKVVVFERNKRY